MVCNCPCLPSFGCPQYFLTMLSLNCGKLYWVVYWPERLARGPPANPTVSKTLVPGYLRNEYIIMHTADFFIAIPCH